MFKKNHHSRLIRCFMKLCSITLAVLCLFKVFVWIIPNLSEGIGKVAVVSAGISFLDGGIALVEATVNEDGGEIFSVKETESEYYTQPKKVSEQSAQSDITLTSPNNDEAPSAPQGAGKIIDKLYTAGSTSQYIALPSGYVRNQTSLSAEQILNLASADLPFSVTKENEPQVLIYHTHATESYQSYDVDWFDTAYNARSTDNNLNMVAVGDALETKLKEAGIGVVHDTTLHDYPSYTGAYDRSRQTILSYLEKHPSIKVVLDIHRDAIVNDDTTITAPTTEINGTKTAQVMIISCADNGTGRIPNYTQNFTFACKLQMQAESDYPTLMRPILFDDRFYNQDLSTGALLLEIGGHANTLDEAVNAAKLLGDSLAKVLLAE